MYMLHYTVFTCSIPQGIFKQTLPKGINYSGYLFILIRTPPKKMGMSVSKS